MDKQDWKTANAAVVAIEAERAGLVAHLDVERERILEPTRLRYEVAKAALNDVIEEIGEPCAHCEGCSEPIFEGESYHRGVDVSLCFACSPAYADMQATPEYFRGEDDEPMTQAEADGIVAGHLAAGGSIEDKIAAE